MKTAIFCLTFLSVCCASANDTIEKRQQFYRTISQNPAEARKYINDKDPEIRRYAVYSIIKKDPLAEFAVIENAVNDPDEQVRLTAFSVLPSLIGKDRRVAILLQKLSKSDSSAKIRSIAVQSTWPFHREIKLLRNDPTWDYEVKTIKSISLVNLPWFFTTDPMQQGHQKGWFKKNFNVSKWQKIKIGTWENQGFADYDGIAWYQIKFTMPPKIDCNAVEIAFDGVDESAWVWLNGIYLGAHDKGPEGWKEPFAVDCRKEILWGRENVLTIRVYDAAYAGGIYKPVRVDILK
jgi:hypothetical protein